MADADDELMVTILRDIQARIGRLEDRQRENHHELLRRLSRLEISGAQQGTTVVEQDARMDRMDERLERIERRLELRDE